MRLIRLILCSLLILIVTFVVYLTSVLSNVHITHTVNQFSNQNKLRRSDVVNKVADKFSDVSSEISTESDNGIGIYIGTGADPTWLYKQYASGAELEKVPIEELACYLNNKPHGNVLGRIHVAEKPQMTVQIFCGIYTMEKNHDTNVKATRNTWAKKCDGFMAFSTKNDSSIPSINIEHEGLEEYNNMWAKSHSIWKYIHTHYAEHFDFFLLGGDDMFYIVENFRAYLASDEITQLKEERNGIFIGRKFQPPGNVVFNSGGAGYTLDRKALKVLGANIDSPDCAPNAHSFDEDVKVARCLKLSTNNTMTPYDTRDALQRERFHPFSPGHHLQYTIPKKKDWYALYSPDLKVGYECCSDESISFHYITV